MIWQYMVKTADVGIRAKDTLVRLIATPQSTEAQRGERAFGEGGCGGCHVVRKVSSGPDLTPKKIETVSSIEFFLISLYLSL